MQHSSRTRLALKTKAKSLARVRSAGTLPWLSFDRDSQTDPFSWGSIVESTHWMVLHRPVELAANFGNVKVGTSNTAPVVLAKGANQPLIIQQITASPAVFTETNNCGSSLAAGASCTVNVTFTPTQKGSVSAKLSIALDGKPAVAEVKLLGSSQ
jgi:ASPM-SPD-2-Hydin domain-containing protein